MKFVSRSLPLLALALLAGCVTVPSGPSVMALPGDGRSFDQFRYDEMDCRNYASGQVGGATAEQVAADSVGRSAALGTLIGAAAGAAIGGRSGAAAGAGAGLLIGASAGSGAAQGSYYGLQRRYDHAFLQCMYAKGNRIPGSGRAGYSYPPPPMGYAPPPAPPNYPPPPPPPPASAPR
jgi:hypothetical protein